ncbi:ATP-binding protein [Streptomyces sp. SID8352]|uniref:ATP-binding protein n=1 Tax=Streptomyces sp. SID8352 TaxID=2690338 RepID=UPI00136FAC7A|nr:ATP-binding protein [Streptomyces sp. SID8352]MYU20885.1 ATP-binding protein [Streptomyces sp. SID8352]
MVTPETLRAEDDTQAASLPRTAESVGAGRRVVRRVLREWALSGIADAAELVTSELLTNAVQHARRDSVRLTVTRLSDRCVRVAVVDLSPSRPQPRAARAGEESGRGLEIVEALSGGRWGVEMLREGKRVWAEVACEEAETGD